MKSNKANQQSNFWIEFSILSALVVGGTIVRLQCEHLPNFAPVAGASMFAGWFFSRRVFAFATPLLIMGISNLWLGSYNAIVLTSVISCFLLSGIAGIWLRHSISNASKSNSKTTWTAAIGTRLAIFGCAVAGSLLFFGVTNFAVWVVGQQTLLETYIQAVPFYRFTLYGDLFFTFALFGAYDLCRFAKTQMFAEPRLDLMAE